jgi:ribosomal protein L35
VMRQRLFSGRWLTVMSGDDLRKRIEVVKVGRGSSKRWSRTSSEGVCRKATGLRHPARERRKTVAVVIRARCRKMSELVPPKREHEFASPWTVSRRRSAMRASKDERRAIRREK